MDSPQFLSQDRQRSYFYEKKSKRNGLYLELYKKKQVESSTQADEMLISQKSLSEKQLGIESSPKQFSLEYSCSALQSPFTTNSQENLFNNNQSPIESFFSRENNIIENHQQQNNSKSVFDLSTTKKLNNSEDKINDYCFIQKQLINLDQENLKLKKELEQYQIELNSERQRNILNQRTLYEKYQKQLNHQTQELNNQIQCLRQRNKDMEFINQKLQDQVKKLIQKQRKLFQENFKQFDQLLQSNLKFHEAENQINGYKNSLKNQEIILKSLIPQLTNQNNNQPKQSPFQQIYKVKSAFDILSQCQNLKEVDEIDQNDGSSRSIRTNYITLPDNKNDVQKLNQNYLQSLNQQRTLKNIRSSYLL